MHISRRIYLAFATALACGAAIVVVGGWYGGLGALRAAPSEAPSASELAVAGPLGEEVEGSRDAPVTIIEYASMTCPHCANFDINVYPVLKRRYIDTGKVRYILREFPLDPLSAAGFMLARCTGKEYFEMVDELFRNQTDWVVAKPIPALLKIAKQAGLTQQQFDACLSNQKMLDSIDWVRERAAEKFGVNSTPTFFINGTIHRGDMTIDELEKRLAPALAANSP
jgi:protein-disulfide isomerase